MFGVYCDAARLGTLGVSYKETEETEELELDITKFPNKNKNSFNESIKTLIGICRKDSIEKMILPSTYFVVNEKNIDKDLIPFLTEMNFEKIQKNQKYGRGGFDCGCDVLGAAIGG